MTNVTTFKSAEAGKRKAALECKLKELRNLAGQRDEHHIEHSADPIDQVRAGADREITVRQLDQQTRRIHEIQTALAKFEKGSYGLCEQCEEPIALKRLDVVPWARLCIRCQSAAETCGREHETVLDTAA